MAIVCSSTLTHVNVHARGAVVTRRLTLPDALPDGAVTLAVEGVTPLAVAGSVRAALPEGSGRSVLAVRAAVVVPAAGSLTGASRERVRDLTHRVARLEAELSALGELRGQLGNVSLAPGLRPGARPDGPRDVASRTADALATDAMLAALLTDLDARAVALEASLRDARLALESARLDDAQAPTRERAGAGHPSLRATVHLTGAGPVAHVDLHYVVPAARWWPVYTLRIRDNGRAATWLAEALVAQLTGEDWRGARVSLSTADLLYDARLPELPSLRLGRAQPSTKRAYRPAPQGLARMFEGYDSAFVKHDVATIQLVRGGPPAGGRDAPVMLEAPPVEALMDDLLAEAEAGAMPDGTAAPGALPPAMVRTRRQEMARAGAKPEAPPMQAAMPARKSAGVLASFGGMVDGLVGGGGSPGAPPTREELPLEPADAWMDFDALALGAVDAGPRRGTLTRATDARAEASRADAQQRIEQVAAPAGARDPVESRGVFDHRYEVRGAAEVPSDGQSHRVSLLEGDTAPTLRWRTVPREAPEVFREAELRNPFDAPLLAGPVDVYMDGSLLAVAQVERIDRGGTMLVGMGAEPRLRVARNVREREESAGLLGGDTVAYHEVVTELSSALGTACLVEVVDRLPVSDDKDLEVELLRATPEHERYTQADRGSPVRGAMLWRVIVPAGGRASVEFHYKLTLPSKCEVVGGNRRD